MRAVVLSTLTFAFSAVCAGASADELNGPWPVPPLEPSYVEIPFSSVVFEKPRVLTIGPNGKLSIPMIRGWRLEHDSETYRPLEDIKTREEGIYSAKELSDVTTVKVGVWRNKLTRDRMGGLKVTFIGIEVTRRF